MKRLFLLLFFIGAFTASAQLSDAAVIGKWTVKEVTTTETNASLKEVYNGFSGATFTFGADHKMTFTAPGKSKTFALIANKLASNDWILEGRSIRIGSKADGYSVMVIDLVTSGGDTSFALRDTPVRLKVAK